MWKTSIWINATTTLLSLAIFIIILILSTIVSDINDFYQEAIRDLEAFRVLEKDIWSELSQLPTTRRLPTKPIKNVRKRRQISRKLQTVDLENTSGAETVDAPGFLHRAQGISYLNKPKQGTGYTTEPSKSYEAAFYSEEICYCEKIYLCPAGPPGPPGDEGSPGQPGIPGTSGQPGLPGIISYRPVTYEGCIKCPQGASGPQGPIGLPGPPGAIGRPGLPGAPAIPGPVGPPGPVGDAGPLGIAGQAGEIGIPGAPRITYLVGVRGIKGLPGPQGSVGEPGPPGEPGEPGKIGPVGPVGVEGAPGLNGSPGANGLPAPPGKPGVNVYYCQCPVRTTATATSSFSTTPPPHPTPPPSHPTTQPLYYPQSSFPTSPEPEIGTTYAAGSYAQPVHATGRETGSTNDASKHKSIIGHLSDPRYGTIFNNTEESNLSYVTGPGPTVEYVTGFESTARYTTTLDYSSSESPYSTVKLETSTQPIEPPPQFVATKLPEELQATTLESIFESSPDFEFPSPITTDQTIAALGQLVPLGYKSKPLITKSSHGLSRPRQYLHLEFEPDDVILQKLLGLESPLLPPFSSSSLSTSSPPLPLLSKQSPLSSTNRQPLDLRVKHSSSLSRLKNQ